MKNLISTKTVIIFLSVMSLFGCGKFHTSGNEHTATDTTKVKSGMGDVALDYTLPDLNGDMISSKSLKGKFTVIHFATTWCPFPARVGVPWTSRLGSCTASQDIR